MNGPHEHERSSRRWPWLSREAAPCGGLVADPDAAPVEVARQLHGDLPEALAEYLGEDTSWEIHISYEPLPSGTGEHDAMFDVGLERMHKYGWDLVVCITDIPIRSGHRPVVAEVSRARHTAVVSLPAFGAIRLSRRVRRVTVQLIAELLDRGTDSNDAETPDAPGRKPRISRLPAQFDRSMPDEENIDARVVASRGRQRMLVGMVRSNRPWQVVFGLTGAAAGALAFSAFYLMNSNLWELSNVLGPLRLSVAMFASLMLLVTWLIIRHGLWESPRHADLPHERREVWLFNASTVMTLTIGMLFMYLYLFVILVAAAWLLLDDAVLGYYIGFSPNLGTYASIAWLVTSAAGIAGALGSSFDSEKSVREAAYSYRERQRRAQRDQEQQSAQDIDTGG